MCTDFSTRSEIVSQTARQKAMYNTSDKGHLRRWQGADVLTVSTVYHCPNLVKFGKSITGWYKLRDRLGPDGQVYAKSTNRFVVRARFVLLIHYTA